MNAPKVSVIIPAYNAQATLRQSVEAVLGQVYDGEFELIVVDDGSVDGTASLLKGLKGVRYIFQENRGPAAARNRGAREAAGDILLFTDSDCCPQPGWVKAMAGAFQDGSVGVVAGSYGIANPGDILARIIHGEIRFRHEALMPEFPKVFGSYNFAIRAGLFRQLQGFNTCYRRASGEDNDLSYRVRQVGARIRFLKDVCVDHYHQHILSRYLYEQYRHGFWRARLYLEHAGLAAGDGYTFWKDVLEVPLVVALAASVFWVPVYIVFLPAFLCFEVICGIWMQRSCLYGVMAGAMMWLRAFVRTAGLFSGGAYLVLERLEKGKKN